jgi:radical S-adenosyl methionine domain-containing protein 2
MGFETSLITNGYSLERYLDIFGYLDMLGISVDSLDENVCKNIGRCTRKGDYLSKEILTALVNRARQVNPRIKIKLNTVVSEHNYKSNVAGQLQALKPDRLKILRQLPFDGKEGITDEQFQLFLDINKQACERENIVIEDNGDITHSYIMIDPLGRFFQNGNGRDYAYSKPIFEVGVERALSQISFDVEKFLKRYNDGGASNG